MIAMPFYSFNIYFETRYAHNDVYPITVTKEAHGATTEEKKKYLS